MDKTIINEITNKIYKAASECLGNKLERAFLYGSYARGDNIEDSDIDIMILANIPIEEAWSARMKISRLITGIDLEYDVLISLHVVNYTIFYKYANDLPFYMNVLKDGVVLNAG